MTSDLHIVLPGLLDSIDAGFPPTPALDLLLTRAHVGPMTSFGFTATLFSLFGHKPPTEGDLPSAAFSRLGEGNAQDAGFWLHADPVAIQPTRDRLVLLGNAGLGVTREEADSLVRIVNEAFGEEGWRMEAAAPNRWYLRVPRSPVVTTCHLDDAIGRDVKACLPTGDGGSQWCRVLNEIQMLFHDAEVNRIREEAGQRPINSIWLYGAGKMPDSLGSPFDRVVSDHPLGNGLALASGTEVSSGSAFTPKLAHGVRGSVLWVDSGLRQARYDPDFGALSSSVGRIESALSELPSLLRTGRLAKLSIYPCDGRCFRVDAAGIRRFWKRRRTLSYFSANSSSSVRQ